MSKAQPSRRPIRIGNASGAIGDGIDQVYRLALSNVDAITADYLAEFNIAWKAIELQTNPEGGYEPNFLEQLAWHNGDAAREIVKKKIKVVHDGGALNPRGLAAKVDEYLKSLGLNAKVAWVEGDNVTRLLKQGELGPIRHLDKQIVLDETHGEVLAANAYTGHAGVVAALEADAQIIICGRCCDASPVTGLATWWHGWKARNLDATAGALMAGHLIECGAYVTGGNYCGQQEIPNLHHVGYPIAEIAADGTAVITKAEGTNGAVTVDTCKAQLLYEIQGTRYLNPDVVGDIEGARLDREGENRVKLSGIKGLKPPPTAKLAVCLLGGYQAELSGFCAGLDTDYKFTIMKEQVLGQLNPENFTTISIEKYGSSPRDPKSQKECTVHIRMFVQAPKKEAMLEFRRAVFYNGMQGYCGLHLTMDWRTMEPRPYVKYFPTLVPQSTMPLKVRFINETKVLDVPARSLAECATSVPPQKSSEPSQTLSSLTELGDTVSRPLGDLVFARSGDKGGNANVGFWVRDRAAWPWLQAFLTSERITHLLADDWDPRYTIERCEFDNLSAVHFLVKGILQDGVSSSSVLDGFAKSFGEFLRARVVELPRRLLENEKKRRRAAMNLSSRPLPKL